MKIEDPITGEVYDVHPRTRPMADQFCAVCSVRLDHDDDDDLAFTPDARYVHAGACSAIAWGRSDAVACTGGCGCILPEGDGDTCPTCETEGPICSSCGDHHHGDPNELIDADTYRDEDCHIVHRVGSAD